jgi:hypothetical protein
MNKVFPFRVFVIFIVIALIVPMLIQDGMFMDGLIYASVSHNLANGIGSFWFLTFSETFLTDYSEQLPLFIGLQAIFFKLLGSSIYTERVFLLVMVLLTSNNIIKIWNLIHKNDNESKQLEWFAILLWITIPVCFWAYINNVQETLMAVFATASVYFILKGLILKRRTVLYILLGGLSIFLCSFCKGFQGLFPLVTVFLYWLFIKDITFKKMIALSVILLLVPMLIYIGLLLHEVSYQSLVNNFNNRIIRTFTNPNSSTTNTHLYLLSKLFLDLLPAIAISSVIILIHRKKKLNLTEKIKNKYSLLFLFIGICGSLPLMITSEQRAFYLVTSLPFFAISIALIGAPYLKELIKLINSKSKSFKVFKLSSMILIFVVIIVSGLQYGKARRDKDMLHDVYTIGATIPKHSTLSVLPELRKNYALVAYFSRHFHINLDMDSAKQNEYYLKEKENTEEVHKEYSKVYLDLKKYELYKKKR